MFSLIASSFFPKCEISDAKVIFHSEQAAQAHYLWVRASAVIWSEYTRIISVVSDAK